MYKKFLLENLNGREHSEYPGVDRRVTLEWILWKWSGRVWKGCTWLRIGSSDGLL
jgi:hypothetical protein